MKKIIVDRQDFIDCYNGDLLIREGINVTHLGDAASFAMDAAEQGKEVFLTINGVIVSKFHNGIEIKID